ncbi:MAG: hypothetical protein WC626_13245 [Methanoregula sp.]
MGIRSFGLVALKVAEADFFLEKISGSGPNIFEVKCYLSAFAASSRSVTFSLQAVLSDIVGFDEWYKVHQIRLQKDPLSKFFNDFRRVTQHVGNNYGMKGTYPDNKIWIIPTRDLPSVPEDDIETAGRKNLTEIIKIVFDCYKKFGPIIDSQQRYTREFFTSIGKTIEDAEEECGFPRGWTDTGDEKYSMHRWQALRDTQPGCEINHLFKKYLKKKISGPKRVY